MPRRRPRRRRDCSSKARREVGPAFVRFELAREIHHHPLAVDQRIDLLAVLHPSPERMCPGVVGRRPASRRVGRVPRRMHPIAPQPLNPVRRSALRAPEPAPLARRKDRRHRLGRNLLQSVGTLFRRNVLAHGPRRVPTYAQVLLDERVDPVRRRDRIAPRDDDDVPTSHDARRLDIAANGGKV